MSENLSRWYGSQSQFRRGRLIVELDRSRGGGGPGEHRGGKDGALDRRGKAREGKFEARSGQINLIYTGESQDQDTGEGELTARRVGREGKGGELDELRGLKAGSLERALPELRRLRYCRRDKPRLWGLDTRRREAAMVIIALIWLGEGEEKEGEAEVGRTDRSEFSRPVSL